ncbi:MAG TPA: DUF4349 domain-containing protein [Marmoricola sp.]|nr:DUF4349 domain-containing protein [Marmoricola sp.]
MTKSRLLLLLPAALLVAACSSPGTQSADSAGGNTAVQSQVPRPAGSKGFEASQPAHGRPAVLQRQVISHGDLEIRSKDVARSRGDVLRLLQRWDGIVANEETGSDAHGRMSSVSLVLRVPSADFAEAMRALAGVARPVHQEISSRDVTTEVIDVQARLRAKQDAIRRIEQLLAHAKSLGQIIAIETDLSNRQAELDSLKQQHAYLADQTSMSTITVSISRVAAPPHHAQQHEGGLLGGLTTGWHALGAVVVGLLTLVGVVLPFALAAGVVVVPLWLGWRRWGRKPAVSAPVDAE